MLLPYVDAGAERVHASGFWPSVLRVLIARTGLTLGGPAPGRQLWDWLVFVLEGLSFVLVGVQLRPVVQGIEGRSLADLAMAVVALNLVVIVSRLAWVYPASWLPRRSARVRERDPFPGWGSVTVIGWAGMRGVVTLALALAIPTEVEGGGPFPDRNLVVFLAFSVIVVTLIGRADLRCDPRRGVVSEREGPPGQPAALALLSDVALDRLDAVTRMPRGSRPSWSKRLRNATCPGATSTIRARTAGTIAGLFELSTTCSGPSGRSCAGCAGGARSRPRWPAALTTTWTWRSRAWSASAPADSRGRPWGRGARCSTRRGGSRPDGG